ncbi:N-acetylmuramoyl-L-alanine amidase [Sediminibacterium sp.]|uniref:N-acetylmuramoyl-L-alanine amidase family protein n=1 Tax=Sediminibacterium sp. TaxID=1917865 RepID=UPI00272379B3|nr:N-acetylmuramoyl-L-alanine amidase [Sediminibacterium sp.]MDO9000506.1 N-acetylmuramoyl-L-alanine amidase [Bacteroidota bacterium]MDP3146926.1 N-acetylmuramoyl-L-alanine amidase [Bacteroidota bacterium]MDP3567536.1 N-acetylmuramoyl-L-alanine amidase [Sediminibacterium sp.]
MVKKIKYFVFLFGVIGLFAAFTHNNKDKSNAIKIVVIDPGHGGKDPGCSGASHKEKDISLAVALKLGKLIEENLKDVKVIYTRTTDIFVELEDRAQIANKAKADLFISIHCNAAGKPVMIKDPKTGKKRAKTYKNKKGKYVVVEQPNPIHFGTETYVMGLKNEAGNMKVATRENSVIFLEDDYEKKYDGFDPESEESYIIMSNYTSAYVIQSASLAMKIQDEYTKKAGRIDKGVHRQSIWVLWRTAMPSILTEIGFLTNPLEETFLASETGQDYLAKSIFRGLRKYKDDVEGTKKEYNDDIENQIPIENENIKAGNIPGKKMVDDDDDDKKEEVKVNDGKSTTTEIKDSVKTNEPNLDSIATAKEIAEKFKIEKATENTSAKNQIVFKVQFASSEVTLDLKQAKFNAIVDGAYYKDKNVLKYTSGNYSLIKDATNHQSFLREKGFSDCFVIALKNGERINVAEAIKITGQ